MANPPRPFKTMKVTVEPVHIKLPPPKQARSAGVHVSSIIRCVAMETGILGQERLEDLSLIEVGPSMRFSDPVVALRVCIGLAWEDWYIPEVLALEGVIDHPGEYLVDGIYMSPDGEELSQIIVDRRPKHMMKVHEVKATYKSINTVGTVESSVESQFLWMAQIKAYCKAIKTTWADLHVLFLCGDYSYPIQPQLLRYHLEFDQEEIDYNWKLLTGYRDMRLKEQKA